MYWEKEIRIKLTTRRLIGAILATMSVVNLFIVGVAYNATSPLPSSTPTPSQTITLRAVTMVSLPNSQIESVAPTLLPTHTATQTPYPSHTNTAIPTTTYTNFPNPVSCTPRIHWPIYIIQRGDTLYSLARTTGSTVKELMLANCLYTDRIYAGQILHVPRLPIKPETTAPGVTPSETEPPVTETNYPPIVAITNPPIDTSYVIYNTNSKQGGLLFAQVLLQGKATDIEDGDLYGSSLVWTTDQTTIHKDPILGTGAEADAILYSPTCYGALHTITLTATDKDGNQAKAIRRIFIYCEY